VTGRRVFEAPGAVDMLIKHAKDPPPAPSEVTELDIPADLDRIILQCLAKDPRERPASVDDLARDLRAVDGADAWTAESASRWWTIHRPPKPAAPDTGGGTVRALR
jgi:serine/threonine protein kinase